MKNNDNLFEKNINGKNIIITGSGVRLGRELALEFARNGWNIALHYNKSGAGALKTAEEIHKMGREAITLQADLLEYKQLESAFDEAFRHFGNIDMLVNNAGVFPEARDMKDIPLDLWESTFGVNMRASFYTSQLFVKRAKPGGRIVNIASIGGLEVWKGRIPYNVSKASLINLSRAMARDLAPDFSVNCVCPGTITFPDDPPEMATDPMIKKIPMNRFATPKDLFEAVYFFGTSSGYITGQTLVVDGGYHDSR